MTKGIIKKINQKIKEQNELKQLKQNLEKPEINCDIAIQEFIALFRDKIIKNSKNCSRHNFFYFKYGIFNYKFYKICTK